MRLDLAHGSGALRDGVQRAPRSRPREPVGAQSVVHVMAPAQFRRGWHLWSLVRQCGGTPIRRTLAGWQYRHPPKAILSPRGSQPWILS